MGDEPSKTEDSATNPFAVVDGKLYVHSGTGVTPAAFSAPVKKATCAVSSALTSFKF